MVIARARWHPAIRDRLLAEHLGLERGRRRARDRARGIAARVHRCPAAGDHTLVAIEMPPETRRRRRRCCVQADPASHRRAAVETGPRDRLPDSPCRSTPRTGRDRPPHRRPAARSACSAPAFSVARRRPSIPCLLDPGVDRRRGAFSPPVSCWCRRRSGDRRGRDVRRSRALACAGGIGYAVGPAIGSAALPPLDEPPIRTGRSASSARRA